MNKRELHAKARNNPRGLPFNDLTALAEAFGYQLDRISGSHHIFMHEKASAGLNLQPDRNGMAKAYQVRQLLRDVADFGLTLEAEENRS